MRKSLLKSILPFLPLLLVYLALVALFSHDELIADEGRHMEYAINLTNGFYSDTENPSLRNGPGYPLLILPFVLINAPYIIFKLLNSLLLFIAAVFFFKTIVNYVNPRKAILLTYLFGLYPPFLKWLNYIHSETFSILLVCGFMYFFLRLNKQSSNKFLNMLLSASFLGILALTKVMFGYVLIVMTIIFVAVYFLKKSEKIKHTLIVIVGGFLFCIPYLFYTYSLTGKTLYWGTHSGEILYWRSTPFENEYGEWISSGVILGKVKDERLDNPAIIKNHRAFIESLEVYSHIERDSIYKKRAIENIKKYPIKYFQNTAANTLRLFFNYPFSYTPQKLTTFFYIVPNTFLFVLLLWSIYLAIRNLRLIPFEIRVIMLMSLIFFCGLVFSIGRVRHLLPIIPIFLLFIIFLNKKLVRIKINTEDL